MHAALVVPSLWKHDVLGWIVNELLDSGIELSVSADDANEPKAPHPE